MGRFVSIDAPIHEENNIDIERAAVDGETGILTEETGRGLVTDHIEGHQPEPGVSGLWSIVQSFIEYLRIW